MSITGTYNTNGQLVSFTETRDFNGDGVQDTLYAYDPGNAGGNPNPNWVVNYTDGQTGQTRSGSINWTMGNGTNPMGWVNLNLNGNTVTDRYYFSFQRTGQGTPVSGYTNLQYNLTNTNGQIQMDVGGGNPQIWPPYQQFGTMTGTFYPNGNAGRNMLQLQRDFNNDGYTDTLHAEYAVGWAGPAQWLVSVTDGASGQIRAGGQVQFTSGNYTSGTIWADLDFNGTQDALQIQQITVSQGANGAQIRTYSATQQGGGQQWPPFNWPPFQQWPPFVQNWPVNNWPPYQQWPVYPTNWPWYG